MARSGMAELIQRLRALTATGTADYTVGTVSYWTDDQLEDVLDRRRTDLRRDPLTLEPLLDGGTTRYYDYYFARENVEGTASGTAAWRVENSNGSTIGASNYSLNIDSRVISFTTDTLGTAYYLSGRAYDMERAAADVWEQKAADVADRFDLEIDNHNMKRSQLYDHYMKMATQFKRRAKPVVGRMVRSDAY